MKRTIVAACFCMLFLVAGIVPSASAQESLAHAATSTIEISSIDNANVLTKRVADQEKTMQAEQAVKQGQADDTQLATSAIASTTIEIASPKTAPTASAAATTTDKVLSYSATAIEAVGTQETTGHSVCCPGFACAYADAVLDGTVNDHSYYGCGCCMWTDWGGGDSSYRSVGSDTQLLREAYDQISSGRPTVIHVSASYGEHWIALIGYTGALDPDNLTLDNFIALDPWDASQVVAGGSFSLYGDGCEHISAR